MKKFLKRDSGTTSEVHMPSRESTDGVELEIARLLLEGVMELLAEGEQLCSTDKPRKLGKNLKLETEFNESVQDT